MGGLPAGQISADYFAMFCVPIQPLIGADVQRPPLVGILANGPCGDVNNIGGGRPGVNYAPGERMRAVADDVAHEVVRVHRTLRFHDGVELKAAAAELELKRRHPTPELVARAGSGWRVRPAPRPFTSAKRRMPSARWMRRTGRIK